MVRASLEPDAPSVLLSVFPSGGAQVAVRDMKGGGTDRIGRARS